MGTIKNNAISEFRAQRTTSTDKRTENREREKQVPVGKRRGGKTTPNGLMTSSEELFVRKTESWRMGVVKWS
jgi:hypothetical protein